MTLALLMLGCAAAAPERRARGDAPDRGPLQLVLRTDGPSYSRTQPVMLTLTVTNTGAAAVSVTAPSSKLYDFSVRRDGAEVWRWSETKMFLAAITEWTLEPGTIRQFSERWNQWDRDGRPAEPGDYVVEGWVIGGERLGLRPERITITIR